MNEEQLKAIRDYIHFIVETGQLSGEDNVFIKAMYYDFKQETKKLAVK